MANVTVGNYTLAATNDVFSSVWKLTRALKKAGYTYKASSDGTTKDTSGTATNDKWGGNADPLTDTYPSLGNGAWLNLEGPINLKISFGTAGITGTFLRGESVTQATSGATGELLGIIQAADNSGYAVISPRTGTFNGTNIITGAISGATFTSTGVATFTREFVFWRGSNLISGTIYYQCVDNSAESSSKFSTLSTSAGCTATIAPGGGGTGNAFPAISIALLGTGGTATHGTWQCGNYSGTFGPAQIMVANNIASSGVSADGSFVLAMGTPSTNSGSFTGFAFQRCDDTEEGDTDPYVAFIPSTATFGSTSRTANTTVADSSDLWFISLMSRTNRVSLRGWRRRGFTTVAGTSSNGDAFQDFLGAVLCISAEAASPVTVMQSSTGDPEKVASTFQSNVLREPVWIVSTTSGSKIRKGTLRWMYIVAGGNGTDTFDTKKWVQLSTYVTTLGGMSIVAGPWDGTTTPTNT